MPAPTGLVPQLRALRSEPGDRPYAVDGKPHRPAVSLALRGPVPEELGDRGELGGDRSPPESGTGPRLPVRGTVPRGAEQCGDRSPLSPHLGDRPNRRGRYTVGTGSSRAASRAARCASDRVTLALADQPLGLEDECGATGAGLRSRVIHARQSAPHAAPERGDAPARKARHLSSATRTPSSPRRVRCPSLRSQDSLLASICH